MINPFRKWAQKLKGGQIEPVKIRTIDIVMPASTGEVVGVISDAMASMSEQDQWTIIFNKSQIIRRELRSLVDWNVLTKEENEVVDTLCNRASTRDNARTMVYLYLEARKATKTKVNWQQEGF